MANEKHLLVTWGGSYTDSDNAAEVWANTLRINVQNTDIDPVGTLPNDWNVVPQNVARTETSWTINGNWRVDFGSALFLNVDDWMNDTLAPALDTWLGQSGISNQTRLDWAKVFPIGTTGTAIPAPPYAQGSPMLLQWTSSNPTGDDGANLLPLQNSLVISHRTAQLGRRGRGRVFRAGMSVNSNGVDGRVPSTYVGFLRDAEVALLEALGQPIGIAGDIDCKPCVIGSPWNQYAVINSVRVGDRMDTQRRRRAQAPEVYSSADVTY